MSRARSRAFWAAVALCAVAVPKSASAGFWDRQRVFEAGIYGGVLFNTDEHQLYNRDVVSQKEYEDVAPDIGFRLGYLPLRHLGIEAEGEFQPTSVKSTSDSATLWGLRAHLVGQYPLVVTPFVVVGGGIHGVSSEKEVQDADVDGVFHYGVGAKVKIVDWLLARLDGRHMLALSYPFGMAHFFELTAGLSVILGKKKEEKPIETDRDGDGFKDADDTCPDEAGGEPDGCPPKDRDGDGVVDGDDRCPDEAGTGPDGCPPRVEDRDNDGIPDQEDKCPDKAGVAPDGCPKVLDRDGDGIPDERDQCPDKPESKNNYEDDDGCPDVVPTAVKKFTGTIRGITFALNSAKILVASHKTLDAAVKVMTQYPKMKVRIDGHTDNIGSEAYNQDLSQRRAEAVRAYLVSKGVSADRLTVKGFGPDKPRANNASVRGRKLNRRIEFTLSQ